MNQNKNQFPVQQYQEPLRRIEHEEFDLSVGPLNLHLGLKDDLQIVDWQRDLPPEATKGLNPNVPYLVVDPKTLKVDQEQGYKSIREVIPTTLGRDHQHGRFNFDTVHAVSFFNR